MSAPSSAYTTTEFLPTRGEILIVDDEPAQIRLLSQLLSAGGYRVRVATSGAQGIRAVHLSLPDVVMLDVVMPDLDGYEVCRRLKSDPCTQDLPVIFLSALDATGDKVLAFDAGGSDYVTKPYQSAEVLARVQVHVERQRAQVALRRLNEELQTQLARIESLQDSLRERERRLRLIVENTSDVVFAFDMNRNLIYANPAVAGLTGFSDDELRQGGFVNWLHPEDRVKVLEWREGVYQGRPFSTLQYRIITKDGQVKWVEGACGPLRDEGGEQVGVQGSCRDISERKGAEEERERLLAREAAARSRTEADERARQQVADFLHGRVQTRMLVAWRRLGEARQLLASDMVSALHILDEARDLIDAIREQDIRKASHQLHPPAIAVGLVPAILWLVEQYSDALSVTVDVGPRLAEMDSPIREGIPQSLRLAAYRVVEEALANVYRHSGALSAVVALGLDDQDRLTVEVKDDGCGFDLARAQRGLGLSSIAGRVEMVGGDWRVESSAGQGTRVSVVLPLGE